jgi:hypothetical protein
LTDAFGQHEPSAAHLVCSALGVDAVLGSASQPLLMTDLAGRTCEAAVLLRIDTSFARDHDNHNDRGTPPFVLRMLLAP